MSATVDMITSVDDGKPLTELPGLRPRQGRRRLRTSGGFVDDIQAEIDGYADQIMNGEIKVPTTP